MSGVALLTSLLAGCTFPDGSDGAAEAEPSRAGADPVAENADGTCQDEFAMSVDLAPAVPTSASAYLVLTNEGPSPCELSGHPVEAAFLSESGPIETLNYEGSPVADDFGRAGETVAVAPGGTAFVWARITLVGERAEVCEFPTTVTGLRLLLPGASAPVDAPLDAQVCLDTGLDDLQVGPIDVEQRPAVAG